MTHAEIQAFIDKLDDEDLMPLYNQIGHRLNLIRKARDLYALSQISIGQRAAFHSNGQHIEGIIIRINQRTVSIFTDDGHRWTVSPLYLQRVAEPERPAAPRSTKPTYQQAVSVARRNELHTHKSGSAKKNAGKSRAKKHHR